MFDHVFLVSAQIVAPLILGIDYLLSSNLVMNFKEAYFTTERDGVIHKRQFICEEKIAAVITEDLISRTEFPRRYIPTRKATEPTETDKVTTFETSRENSTDTFLAADKVDDPCYSNMRVIADRSDESSDDDKSKNLDTYAPVAGYMERRNGRTFTSITTTLIIINLIQVMECMHM